MEGRIAEGIIDNGCCPSPSVGRSLPGVDSPAGGIVEVGAEALEGLQLPTEDTKKSSSSAAALAKALYAGLGGSKKWGLY